MPTPTIALPTALLDSTLTLDEIGALVLLQAIADQHVPMNHERMRSAEGVNTVQRLHGKGIFALASTNGQLTVALDFTKATPANS
jgi:predicted transcriptional regulator YheO